jgi:hypothetical protein
MAVRSSRTQTRRRTRADAFVEEPSNGRRSPKSVMAANSSARTFPYDHLTRAAAAVDADRTLDRGSTLAASCGLGMVPTSM